MQNDSFRYGAKKNKDDFIDLLTFTFIQTDYPNSKGRTFKPFWVIWKL